MQSVATTPSAPSKPLAFADVFREHAPFAWRCLRRMGLSAADADDVCQEVFLVVHRRLGDYDGRSSLRAWIFGICVRKASDNRRLAFRKHECPTDQPPEQATESGPAESADRKRALHWLDDALLELDADKRAAFVLYEIEGLTLAELASAVDCPLQTAYSRLHAARAHVEAAISRRRAQGRGS